MKIKIAFHLLLALSLIISKGSEAQVVEKTGTEKSQEPKDYQLLFVGDASIQKSFNQGSEIPANAGLGVIFIKNYEPGEGFLKTKRMILEATINIASTVDTIKASVVSEKVKNVRDYGNFIVNPYLTGQSASLRIIGYMEDASFTERKLNKFINFFRGNGYEGSVAASNRLWELNSDSIANATSMAIRLGFFWEFIPKEDYKDYSIRISLINVSSRFLFGDITQNSNLVMRKKLTGTDQNVFLGWEPTFQIRLKNINASFSFPIFYSNDNVSAISGGQFATSIGFNGGFSLSLNGKKGTDKNNQIERDR